MITPRLANNSLTGSPLPCTQGNSTMVGMSRRRRASEPLPFLSPHSSGSHSRRSSSLHFMAGIGRHRSAVSPLERRDDEWSPLPSSGRLHSAPSWNVWIVLTILSWVSSQIVSSPKDLVSDLMWETNILQAQLDHLQDDLNSVTQSLTRERKQLNTLKKTQRALQHEQSVIQNVEQTTGRRMMVKNSQQTIQNWLEHRTDSLLEEAEYYQRYLQATSREKVQKTYGNGPQRVEFTVDVVQSNKKRNLKTFVVELAPLHLMPVSVHMFLDTIAAGIWDHTVFLHHEQVDHVLAAAPVDYETKMPKTMALGRLGWLDLGFPEYAHQYPHAKYTLGYAKHGPSFYINTVDNSEGHGPGGQEHHLLESDADPCFARVIEGTQVIDNLIQIGMKRQPRVAMPEDQDKADEDTETWTHIVSVRLL